MAGDSAPGDRPNASSLSRQVIDASPDADTSRTEGGAVATAVTSRRHTERTIHILVGAVLTLFFLSSYIATLAPTVLWGDSGSFQTRAYILGIPHPTPPATQPLLCWASCSASSQ